MPGEYARNAPSPNFTAPSFGVGGVPSYGPPPAMPVPRPSRGPRVVLLALIALAVLAIAGFVVAGLSEEPAEVAYANDDYEVPPPDTIPPELPVPETYEQAEQWITANALYGQTVPAPVRCNSMPINVTTATRRGAEVPLRGADGVSGPGLAAAGHRGRLSHRAADGDDLRRPDHHQVRHRRGERLLLLGRPAALLQQPAAGRHRERGREQVDRRRGDGPRVRPPGAGPRPGSRSLRTRWLSAAGTRRPSSPTCGGWRPRPTASPGCSCARCRCRSASSRTTCEGIVATYAAIGDDTLSGDPNVVGNHGLARSRKYWGTAGLGSGEVATCNTFTAPPHLVR